MLNDILFGIGIMAIGFAFGLGNDRFQRPPKKDLPQSEVEERNRAKKKAKIKFILVWLLIGVSVFGYIAERRGLVQNGSVYKSLIYFANGFTMYYLCARTVDNMDPDPREGGRSSAR